MQKGARFENLAPLLLITVIHKVQYHISRQADAVIGEMHLVAVEPAGIAELGTVNGNNVAAVQLGEEAEEHT